MIVQTCRCGGIIAAPDLDGSAPYIEAHNSSDIHRAWRLELANAEFLAELLPSGHSYRVPRRPTAGRPDVDVSVADQSASDAEGTA